MARRTPGSQPLRNFHVPLPEDLYHALQVEAEQARRPANALAREAIASWLDRQRQAHIDQAILAYAEAAAGTPEDLDPDIETVSLESLAQQV